MLTLLNLSAAFDHYCFIYLLTLILSLMESSKLKLNLNKTDIIIIGKKTRKQDFDYFTDEIVSSDTSSSDTIRNLGVVFDSNYRLHQYIYQVCKSM